jgi:hypothetical protein
MSIFFFQQQNGIDHHSSGKEKIKKIAQEFVRFF